MSKHTERACPCCGGRQAEVLHGMGFTLPAGSPLPERYDLVACEACGSCYADTSKTQADYDFYYAEFSKYESETLASGSGADADDAARLRDTAAALAGHVPATARVLDIGAANGGLLAALRERGFAQLTGLDPSPRCVDVMRRAGFAAVRGALTDPFVADVKYDLVVLSHVLEHVLDVGGALREVGAALADGGLVYVEVPDAGAYAQYLRTPFYYFDSEHINHFNLAALTSLLGRHGYDAIASGHKALKLPDGPPYPALWVLARRRGAIAELPATDFGLRESLKGYIAQSEASSANQAIDKLAASRQPVLIWGAGQNTMRLLQSSRLAECNIVGIVDGDARKQGQIFAGHTVGAPRSLAGRQDLPVVLISAAIHGKRIAEELHKLLPEQPFTLV